MKIETLPSKVVNLCHSLLLLVLVRYKHQQHSSSIGGKASIRNGQ